MTIEIIMMLGLLAVVGFITTITSVINITITTDDGLDQSKSKNGLTLEAHINVS